MTKVLEYISDLLDVLFFSIISPFFTLVGRVLEILLLNPLQMALLPPALQVACIAVITAFLSIWLRRVFKVEEKEGAFREQFLTKKSQQDDLHLISDWKSRQKFAKAIDDDIDEDFNTYLAGRFARYGLVYLLPIFLILYWLETFTGYTIVIELPGNRFGLSGIPSLVVFLVSYCFTLFIFFRVRKSRKKKNNSLHLRSLT